MEKYFEIVNNEKKKTGEQILYLYSFALVW